MSTKFGTTAYRKTDRLIYAVLNSWTFQLEMTPYRANSLQEALWLKWCRKRDRKRYTTYHLRSGKCGKIPQQHAVWDAYDLETLDESVNQDPPYEPTEDAR